VGSKRRRTPSPPGGVGLSSQPSNQGAGNVGPTACQHHAARALERRRNRAAPRHPVEDQGPPSAVRPPAGSSARAATDRLREARMPRPKEGLVPTASGPAIRYGRKNSPPSPPWCSGGSPPQPVQLDHGREGSRTRRRRKLGCASFGGSPQRRLRGAVDEPSPPARKR